MRTVHLIFLIPDRSAQQVYERLSAFERYPDLCDAVQSVHIRSGDVADISVSEWEVKFRAGLLRWIEEDTFDRDRHQISFRQLEGDMALFEGFWRCDAVDGATELVFSSTLDMGIPSLADALEPIAVRTFRMDTLPG